MADSDLPLLIGESAPIRLIKRLIRDFAGTDLAVLITGESGTGKELVARSLHQLSSRRNGPFIAVNCAALPATLWESELWGHERGAFTDAKTLKQGRIELADHG